MDRQVQFQEQRVQSEEHVNGMIVGQVLNSQKNRWEKGGRVDKCNEFCYGLEEKDREWIENGREICEITSPFFCSPEFLGGLFWIYQIRGIYIFFTIGIDSLFWS